jgi:putative flavoprotein involved in K+ transport
VSEGTTSISVTAEEATSVASPEAREITTAWLRAFEDALSRRDVDGTLGLLAADPWWRDTLAFTWDIRSLHGAGEFRAVLDEHLADVAPHAFRVAAGRDPVEQRTPGFPTVVLAQFTFETALAHARGAVRLVEEDGAWKAWTLATDMTDLTGHEESGTSIHDAADDQYIKAQRGRPTWAERRAAAAEFREEDPTVLIVGGGHSGLFLAARLKRVGISSLVAERNGRIGDNWRLRYNGCTTHDTFWNSQFPYMPFPSDWPLFTPKDLMGDWQEMYAVAMRLNTWTSAEVTQAAFDEADGRWTVTVRREGEDRTVRPKHLVFATGNSGEPHVPVVPGAERFRGEVAHSSLHRGGKTLEGKRVVVVGSATSGHDIAQDAYEHGAASITMVQRNPTYLISARHGIPAFFSDHFSETSPPTEDADMLSYSMPYELATQLAHVSTDKVAEQDAELIAALEAKGFRTTLGKRHGGILEFALEKAGGYYIDKGASRLIVDGEVRVQPGEIAEFTETGVVYSDGTTEEADVVAFATGWSNMREATRPVLGDELTDRLSVVWGQDEEGELRGLWRPSGHPRFWFMAGGFQNSRYHSKHLALHIKAIEEGIHPAERVTEAAAA